MLSMGLSAVFGEDEVVEVFSIITASAEGEARPACLADRVRAAAVGRYSWGKGVDILSGIRLVQETSHPAARARPINSLKVLK